MNKEHLRKSFEDWLTTIPTDSVGINLDVVNTARFNVGVYMTHTRTEDIDELHEENEE